MSQAPTPVRFIHTESPLIRLKQGFAQTKLDVKEAKKSGQDPVAAFKDSIRQARGTQTPTTQPVLEVPRGRAVYVGFGEQEAADFSRTIAIKKSVGRAKASCELHRSNAVRGASTELSRSTKGQ